MSSKLAKIALAAGGLVLLAVLVGIVVFYVWLNRWLAGDDCRKLISGLVSKELKIEGSFQPFHWSGFSVYSEGFDGKGMPGGSVKALRAEQVRAELNFSALLRGTWEISEITVARFKADLGETEAFGDDLPSPSLPPDSVEPNLPPSIPFLPRKFLLKEVRIMEADLTWPGTLNQSGSLSKTQINVESDGQDWKFSGQGGKFFQPGLPELKVENYQARFKPPLALYVDFTLRDFTQGSIDGRGQVDFSPGGQLQLELNLKRLDITPFLKEDWRARVFGKLNGPMELKSELGKKDGMKAKGSLKLTEAKVEAFPVLNTIALLTRTQEFRSMKLQTAQADFEWEKGRIAVNNIILESELFLKVTGNYRQVDENVDGLLQVGTTTEALRFIPGAREKVFTESRDGYIWTPVKLSGTAAETKEDLTPRLQDAALGAVMEAVPGVIDAMSPEVKDKVNKGLNGVLDFLNKK